MKYPTLIGQKFEGAIVIELAAPCGAEGKGGRKWLLKCKCGNHFHRTTSAIMSGIVRVRCQACSRKAQSEKAGKSNLQHGESDTYLHNLWIGMRKRCSKPGRVGYHNYGGRGIAVYPEWDASYVAFAKYIREHLGNRPDQQYSLDRIDNDAGYEPGNLRWATSAQQATNKRPYRKPEPGSPAAIRFDDLAWPDLLAPYTNRSMTAAAAGLCVSLCKIKRAAVYYGITFAKGPAPKRELPKSSVPFPEAERLSDLDPLI